MKVLTILRGILADVRGATAIEYGLILAFVFLAMVGAAVALGDEHTSLWGKVSDKTIDAMTGVV